MRARFAVADALLKVDTVRALEDALGHFNDMLRLCRSDNMGVRDIIPHILLRLGREQECYDFLKWWTIIDDENHYNGRYDWGDATLPYLDIRGADAFEPVDIFCSSFPDLSHIVALTLLKLRLCLDLTAYNDSLDGFAFAFGGHYSEPDRPIGRLVRAKLQTMDVLSVSTMVEKLEDQYCRLCQVVNDANPYFWDALVSEETPPLRYSYTRGSEAEADIVLRQCQRAWQETEDAIMMIDSETWRFIRPYEGRSRAVRFLYRTDQRKVLVYADGACAHNGQLEPRAGWAVVCGRPELDEKINCYVVSGRLENKGPFGNEAVATSNRAELRAAIAALRLCDWRGEGYDAIVIATDSSYVVDGATGWAKSWVRNGWKTRTGRDVQNKDLWDLLLGEVERWNDQGLRIELWKIPRELNGDADAAAKQAAVNKMAENEFRDITIGPSQTTTAGTEPGHRILTLCLEHESLFDACFGSLVSHITSKVKMERVTTKEAALSILTQESSPSVILIADGALTRQRKVWECVIDRLREGATVVLAGCFSNMVREGEFNRFFARLGLPWQRGSYHRTTVSLRRGAVGAHLASRLPSAYSQKALFVKNMERSAAWYTETETSDEAAVVFAKVGSGRLGYVGDVNGEESSDLVVMAMCGLLD
ncbi:Ribonuclease H [Pleurostoma richardsiae]|uniref:ribonuclease H n=1 Tax=Pleurostoma richardsiae TaxID=41990 RepID=A0AA38RGW4_9PEZI|nr:Ribonuclease H [Pleurostoma richardsiae]